MSKKKIQSLQSFRFFAALGVVQYHLWQNYLGVAIGHPGTDFFLVLVGFVAAYTQAKRIPTEGALNYLKSRYVRLYVTYIPLFIIVLFAKWNEVSIEWAVRSFLFIPNPDRPPVIGCTWMISMFMVFYYLFSLSFLARTEKILWFIFGLWVTLTIAYSWLDWRPNIPNHLAKILLSERNLDFVMGYLGGIVLRKQWLTFKMSRFFMWSGLVGLIVGTILLNIGYNSTGRALYIGFPVTIFITGVACLEIQNAKYPFVKALTKSWLYWLGGTSYVLYLSHGLFLQLWGRFFPVTLLFVPIITLGAILIGILGYIFWEEPILKSIKHRRWEYPKIRDFPKNLREILLFSR